MRRWGQITEAKPASWYAETAKSVYLPEVYRAAADLLVEEGVIEASDYPAADYDGYKAPTSDFIDGVEYDGKKPISYINAHKIGNKDDIALEAK